MSSQFQIVFKGELLEGFDPVTVKARAQRRLGATPEQVERLFSGTRAVLKKGLTEEGAQQYFSALERIGMRIFIEPEGTRGAPSSHGASAAEATAKPNAPQRVTSRDALAFDPLKTQIAGATLEPDASPSPERWTQPTIAISQKHLNDLQAAPTSAAPAISAAADPTLIVARGAGQNPAADEGQDNVGPEAGASAKSSAASYQASIEPTIIVPPRKPAPSDPTLIVPPRRTASAEPTMIVPPRTQGAQPTIVVRTDVKRPVGGASVEGGFDAERTLIANSEMLDAYATTEPPAETASTPSASPQPAPPTTGESTTELVQCPTCGDKQPPRVLCRRCGHSMSPGMTQPPRMPTAPFPLPPQPVAKPPLEETVICEPALDETPAEARETERQSSLTAPSWIMIVVLVAVLMLGAAWLFI